MQVDTVTLNHQTAPQDRDAAPAQPSTRVTGDLLTLRTCMSRSCKSLLTYFTYLLYLLTLLPTTQHKGYSLTLLTDLLDLLST